MFLFSRPTEVLRVFIDSFWNLMAGLMKYLCREQLNEASDKEAVAVTENLRNYSEGVRAFWRRNMTLAYQYPLSFPYHDNLPFGFFVNSMFKEWPDSELGLQKYFLRIFCMRFPNT